jgi:hypothetical protein
LPPLHRGKKRNLLSKAFRKALLPFSKGGREGFMNPHFRNKIDTNLLICEPFVKLLEIR